ncbi:MAG: putative transposase [Verrucomicrobiales bacterium]|jgi:putative transposase
MPRQVRIEYPGAVYHILARGNNRQDIYKNDEDRGRFIATVGEVCEQTGWVIHSYVMMRNHYHMLVETPEANLVAGMKWFQGTYTQRFNAANRRSGHLYQGRYKALMVDPEAEGYFNTVSTYIHLNPFRAKFAGVGTDQALEHCPWSSYPAFLAPPGKRPPWLEVGRVFENYAIRGQSRKERLRYRDLLEDRMTEERDPVKARMLKEAYKPIRRGWAFGDEVFRNWLAEKIEEQGGAGSDTLRGEQRRAHGHQAAKRLLKKALVQLELNEAELLPMKSTQLEKQGIAWLLKKQTVVTGVWLADRLNMGHRVNASRAISRFDKSDEREVKRLKVKLLRCTA